MIIDLSGVEVFDSNEIDFDKRITFIFGKNGTGKSTITGELRKLSSIYEVSAFQGFSNLIDENKRLNAVVLGEENTTISRKIEAKKEKIEVKNTELELIRKTLQKPEDNVTSNFWTRKTKAEQDYKAVEKKIDEFFSNSASKIKKMDGPRVSPTTYNKRNFQEDIAGASLLSEGELKQYIETIKSEEKDAPDIIFPKINFMELENATNVILSKSVVERIKINRLESSPEKREFAKQGLKIHKIGDVCSFCGSKIVGSVFDELESYFSADEVKTFQDEIQNKISEIDVLINQLSAVCIECNKFYPAFANAAKEISQELEEKKKKMMIHLEKLRRALDEKLKFLFETRPKITDTCIDNLDDIEKKYKALRKNNNENDLSKKKEEAIDKLRKHYVKKCLKEFNYDSIKAKLNTLETVMNQCIYEYNTEEEKITGSGGLNDVIRAIQNEIIDLQSETQNENLLAENINKKLKHMVSFELVHVEDDESKGFYRVKNVLTGREREITELSTGEKNIIAFLYFIEKLDEVKETASNKERVIVFDDPMSSNDDGMQYLIIEELQKLMKRLLRTDHFILLTHNKHFYLNVKYGHKYNEDRFIRFQSDGNKTHFVTITRENDDYKTSYESLWNELKLLYGMDEVSADLLLNPIRRIIETFTKFNAINKSMFCNSVDGAMKLFNVNSHSIDDIEAELNGKTKNEIIQMFYDCFSANDKAEHFKKFWEELQVDARGNIIFES